MKITRMILAVSVMLIIFLIVLTGFKPRIIFGLSPWRTQEVFYRHRVNKALRIEYQMQDIGALGYNKRIVKIAPFLFMDFAEEIDTAQIDKNEWQRVDEYINEIGLKGD